MAPTKTPGGATTQYDRVNNSDSDAGLEKGRKPWRGIMGGQYTEIFLAAAILIVPMLALALVLIGLVYSHMMPTENASYVEGNTTGLPLGQAYYVNYSATRLVFVSSVSSTLSTVLMGSAMLLFSYPVAAYLGRKSDSEATTRLPTPFQLSLIVELLEAKLLSFVGVLGYVAGSKKKKVPIVPDLARVISMLLGLSVLAILINLADTWLHVSTNSVTYEQMQDVPLDVNFSPSRALPKGCLTGDDSVVSCLENPSGSGGGGGFINQDEYVNTAANASDFSRVYISNGIAVLAAAKPPPDLDFTATSYGSRTSCEVVSKKCKPKFINPGGADASRDISFDCKADIAGLDLAGKFGDLDKSPADGDGTNTDPRNDLENSLGISDLFGFQFYNNAEKTDLAIGSGRPDNSKIPHIWFAWVFVLGAGFNTGILDGDYGEVNPVGLIALQDAGLGAIVSCHTDLYDVTYAFSRGNLTVVDSTLVNGTAAEPLFDGITNSFVQTQLYEGLQNAASAAKTSGDLAAGLATVYDQTLMSVPGANYTRRLPLTQRRRIQTLVTRVPKAPFFCVVLLDLLYAIIGLALMTVALLVVILGRGVRDTQARLTMPAIIAESFESPALGDDAKSVEELYAERRGLAPRRIALPRREDGGRRYKQIVDRDAAQGRQSLTEMRKSGEGHLQAPCDHDQQQESAKTLNSPFLAQANSLTQHGQASGKWSRSTVDPKLTETQLIIVIRHAQSEGNRNRAIHQTVPDHRVKLTQEGWTQAEEAGRRLRSMLRPDDTLQFYTSPYRRTRETTEGIVKSLTSDSPAPSPFPRHTMKVWEEPRLREQDFGNFQPCADAMERMWQERADYGHFFYRIPNGESAADAYDRVSGFNETLWRSFAEDDFPSVCVLVTHGLMTRVFLMKWYHWSVEYFEDLRNINHCEFLVMKRSGDHGKFVLQNQLRTWSELKKRKAEEEGRKADQTHEHVPQKRWGGCPEGCAHETEGYPKREKKTIQATEQQHKQQQSDTSSASESKQNSGDVENDTKTPQRSRVNEDEEEAFPDPAQAANKTLPERIAQSTNQQKKPLPGWLEAGRDFGGSQSGAATPASGMDGEDGYGFPQRSQTPVNGDRSGAPRQDDEPRALGAHDQSRKSAARASWVKDSGMGTMARADALGDQTDEDEDGDQDTGETSIEAQETKDKSIQGSVY
ncbi:MAG: hypothetical protein M1828_000343 [Chrysothrix sp. TS-e1954]|nr:MAG: hypothetical protein M1828_000343 [Chrysothrix sp. TS-e1954]